MHKVVTRKAFPQNIVGHQQCLFRGISNFLLQLTQAHASKISGKYYDLIGKSPQDRPLQSTSDEFKTTTLS
jgi:hypothetical protein